MNTTPGGHTPAETPEIDFKNEKSIDKMIDNLKKCNPLPQDSVKALCAQAKEILVKE